MISKVISVNDPTNLEKKIDEFIKTTPGIVIKFVSSCDVCTVIVLYELTRLNKIKTWFRR